MKIIYCAFVAVLTFFQVQAQELSKEGCATIMDPAEMADLKQWVQNPPLEKTTALNDTIPLTIHIVGDNAASGYYKLETLFRMVCKMNEHFVPSGLYFYIKWPIRYINNSNYYIHNNGTQMMLSNNVNNTVNVYFVEDPAGACGYYSYAGDALAIKKSCAGANSTTLTHEIGHYLGLPHTFSGWENGNTPNNPEKVTRGAGANCSTSGDYFCDTDADYLGARWYCPYTGYKLDANGDEYHPDSSLFMSYSVDACMDRFSPLQMARMHNRLHNNRSNLLIGQPQFTLITDSASLIYPVDTMYANAKNIQWNKVHGADYYHVKVFLTNMPSNVLFETLTQDTSVNFTANITNGYRVTYTVAAMNGANVCRDYISARSIIYSSAVTTSVADLQWNTGLQVFPNPTQDGRVELRFATSSSQKAILKVVNMNGQLLWRQPLQVNAGQQEYNIQLPSLSAGLYILQLQTAEVLSTSKLNIL